MPFNFGASLTTPFVPVPNGANLRGLGGGVELSIPKIVYHGVPESLLILGERYLIDLGGCGNGIYCSF
jgi:hypothetical protein